MTDNEKLEFFVLSETRLLDQLEYACKGDDKGYDYLFDRMAEEGCFDRFPLPVFGNEE